VPQYNLSDRILIDTKRERSGEGWELRRRDEGVCERKGGRNFDFNLTNSNRKGEGGNGFYPSNLRTRGGKRGGGEKGSIAFICQI